MLDLQRVSRLNDVTSPPEIVYTFVPSAIPLDQPNRFIIHEITRLQCGPPSTYRATRTAPRLYREKKTAGEVGQFLAPNRGFHRRWRVQPVH